MPDPLQVPLAWRTPGTPATTITLHPEPPTPVGAGSVNITPKIPETPRRHMSVDPTSGDETHVWVAPAKWDAAEGTNHAGVTPNRETVAGNVSTPPGECPGSWLQDRINEMHDRPAWSAPHRRYRNTGRPERVITPEQVDALTTAALNHHTWPEGVRFGTFKETPMPRIEDIARVAHEANRAWQHVTGDPTPSAPWADAGEHQRESSINGVRAALDGQTPEQLHESWMADKAKAGWVYGRVKNPTTMTHPCMVPYDQLPEADRRKDHLFHAIVAALR